MALTLLNKSSSIIIKDVGLNKTRTGFYQLLKKQGARIKFKKLKICDKGDKLLLYFDIKVREEELIVKLCNLKHTIITKDEVKIIHKRGSGLTLICIYDPN